MNVFRDMSIQRKLVLLMLITSTLSLLLACTAFVAYDLSTLRTNRILDVTTLSRVIGANCTAALSFDAPSDAVETLSGLRARPSIMAAFVYGANDKLFASYSRPDVHISPPRAEAGGYEIKSDTLYLHEPILLKQQRIGTICLVSDLEVLHERIRQYITIISAMLLVSMITAFVLSIPFQRVISGPILHLASLADRVSHNKDYSLRAIRHSGDETGLLTEAFNAMLGQIQQQDEALRRSNEDLEIRVQERTQQLSASRGELALNLSLLTATLESTTDGILVVDTAGRVTSCNQKFTEMWHIPPEILQNRDAGDVIRVCLTQLNDPSVLSTRIDELDGQREMDSFDTLEFQDGRIFEAYSQPQRIGTSCVGRVWSFRNITQRKLSELALENQTKELARSNSELEQFAYVASHDLQEPLRMIASYTQLLARRYKGRLDADADDFIHFAVDGASRMQLLINDLLTFSRVGTRGRPFEPTDLNVVMTRILFDLKIAISESQAMVSHDALPVVMADPMQMAQLFQNLVGNAIKFHRDKAPEIHVGVERTGGEWLFSVRDNGIGIEKEYFDRIFVVFQRLHSREEYPGTGVGLAVCKKIVERHGGHIFVKSEVGKGTTFFFTLPIRDTAEA